MRQLADISLFESLGKSKAISDVSVFNFKASIEIDTPKKLEEVLVALDCIGYDRLKTNGVSIDELFSYIQEFCASFDTPDDLGALVDQLYDSGELDSLVKD